MSNDDARSSESVQSIIREAKRISEDAIYCYAGHSQASRRWDGVNLWLGIFATVLAATAGVLTSLSGNNGSPGIFGPSTNIIAGMLAFLVAAISGLTTFLDPKDQAAKHYKAAMTYSALQNEARIFYQIDCLLGRPVSELAEQVKKLSGRLNQLNSEPVLIPGWAQRTGAKAIKSGGYDYQIDKESKSN